MITPIVMEGKISLIEGYREAYIKVRIIESLQGLQLAVRLLKEGFSRNAASKVFMAWKAMISALVAANLEKMPRDDKEREWYMKAGFLAPTTGLKGISQRLEELGYKVLDLTSTALTLQLPPGLNTSAQWNIDCLPERKTQLRGR
jgi:hypothetical protein